MKWIALQAAMWLCIFVAVIALVAQSGCITPPPGPEPLPPGPDAGTCEAREAGNDACGIAARHVRCTLGCAAFHGGAGIDRVLGTADDDSFAEACRAIGFDTACLASATMCAQAEACE